MSLSIHLDDLTAITQDMKVAVKTYSWNVTGGPKLANVEITGGDVWSLLRWVGKRIEIRNSNQKKVWWGYVEEVLVNDGATSNGLSIREMYNRVRVAYTYELFGVETEGVTDWAVNGNSIETLGFIKEKEERQTIKATPEQAESFRDNILFKNGRPVTVSGAGSGDAKELSATLYCAGDIFSFQWKLYDQPQGLESNEATGGGEQIFGMELTDDTIGFAAGGKVSDVEGRMGAFIAGQQIRIGGSGTNSGTYTIASVDDRPKVILDTTAILAFDPLDDLNFTDGQSSVCELDDAIRLAGNVNGGNNGYFRVTEVDEDHLAVKPKTIVAETSPAAGTLTRGNSFNVGESLSTEIAGIGTIVITPFGTKIAQKIVNPSSTGWRMYSLELKMRKVGTPTDSVRVNIRADTGVAPGAVFLSATKFGSDISTETSVETFNLAGSITFPGAPTALWIEVERTGALNAENYYVVEVDEQLGYTRGNFLLYDPPAFAWWARSPQADLVFRLMGAWELIEQIRQIVLNCGQLITSADIRATTSIYKHQYRDGTTYAYDEIMALLESAKTTGGYRFLATCTADRVLKIDVQPPETEAQYIYNRNAEFLFFNGVKLEEGVLPVGHWIHMSDIPPIVADLYRFSPKFLDEAEYDVATGRIRPTWQGERNVWEQVDN
jgi:hypothetical protein